MSRYVVDDGVPDRGHRANIFNANFKLCGCGFGAHIAQQLTNTIDFAGGIVPLDSV